jgi:regulator of replication initiation timing
MTLKNFNVNDVNSLFEHIEVIHEDNSRLFKENQQLIIERDELKERVIQLEQANADLNVHIIQIHSDLERIEGLYNGCV